MATAPNNNALSTAFTYEKTDGNQLFPVFLKLNDLHTVLIGGGAVGLEKLSAILANSPAAEVTVVSKTFLPQIRELAALYSGVNLLEKAFSDSDLDPAALVVAATADEELNRFIVASAHERKLLVNVADKPELCDFYLSSIVQKGDLKIAISTNGKSPTVAKRLKEVLSTELPADLDISLQQINDLRNTLSGDFAFKVRRLNEVTAVLVSKQVKRKSAMAWLIWAAAVFAVVLTLLALWYRNPDFNNFVRTVNPLFYYFLGAGFVFAMIDGAIGMSYGVTSTTFSLSMGIPPASASMGVHLSEILSNGIAGWVHYRMGNINWKMFRLLLLPGIVGAVAGAYILSSLEHYSAYTKPFISVYTLVLGIVIFRKALKVGQKRRTKKFSKVPLLGLGGGFIDAVGGGGWGSIVLSTLIAGGRHPRYSLGSVKLSRFFIALMSSLTFVTMLSGARWDAVAGLVIGSALAAPIAARISNKLSARTLMIAVAIIVVLVSLRSIILFLTHALKIW